MVIQLNEKMKKKNSEDNSPNFPLKKKKNYPLPHLHTSPKKRVQ